MFSEVANWVNNSIKITGEELAALTKQLTHVIEHTYPAKNLISTPDELKDIFLQLVATVASEIPRYNGNGARGAMFGKKQAAIFITAKSSSRASVIYDDDGEEVSEQEKPVGINVKLGGPQPDTRDVPRPQECVRTFGKKADYPQTDLPTPEKRQTFQKIRI